MDTENGSTLEDLLDGAETDAVAPEEAVVGPTEEEEKKKRRKFLLWFLVGLLAIVLAVIGWYLVTRKPLSSAIPGVNSDRLPTYQTSIYDLTKPLGVAVSSTGDRIYVTEGGAKLDVAVLDADGKRLATVKLPANEMHLPMYVAVKPDGSEVWITDRNTKKIYVADGEGKYLRVFEPKGDLGKPDFSPLGIAFGPDDTVFVTDVRGDDAKQHRVVVFKTDGTFVREMGKPGELNYPNGIAVDGDGTAYVTDSNNGRMVTYLKDGTQGGVISRGLGSGDLGLPRGIGIDDSAHVFVVDTTDHQIRTYRRGDDPAVAPTYIASFGEEGRADGTFEFPNGLATDTRARIYVTDRENNRLQVWGY